MAGLLAFPDIDCAAGCLKLRGLLSTADSCVVLLLQWMCARRVSKSLPALAASQWQFSERVWCGWQHLVLYIGIL